MEGLKMVRMRVSGSVGRELHLIVEAEPWDYVVVWSACKTFQLRDRKEHLLPGVLWIERGFQVWVKGRKVVAWRET